MNTNLTNLKINEFIKLLASSAPAPGGGSASALASSLGAALSNMVCLLTAGKKKYAEFEPEMQEILKGTDKLIPELIRKIDEDTEAFNKVSAVFDMPKETDEEKEARKNSMQEALKIATIVPFNLMEKSLLALELAQKAVGKSNTNAASDLGVSALMLAAGIKGAYLNVLINTEGIKDDEFKNNYNQKSLEIVNKAEKISDEVYGSILESLKA